MPAWAFLAGKKTYLAAGAMITYAASGLVLGEIDANRALELFIEGVSIMALRHGITKETK